MSRKRDRVGFILNHVNNLNDGFNLSLMAGLELFLLLLPNQLPVGDRQTNLCFFYRTAELFGSRIELISKTRVYMSRWGTS